MPDFSLWVDPNLVEQLPYPTLVYREGLVVRANLACCQLLKCSANEIQGAPISSLGIRLEDLPQPKPDQPPVVMETPDLRLQAHAIYLGGVPAALVFLQDLRAAQAPGATHLRRMEVLNKIQQQILAAHSIQDITSAALGLMKELVPMRAGHIILYEDNQQATTRSLVEQAGSFETSQLVENTYHNLHDWPSWAALKSGQPWVENDLHSHPPFVMRDELLNAGVRAVAEIPLIAEGRLLGSLRLKASHAHAYTSEHLHIASEVASSIALAIQQSRLFKIEQKRRHEFEILHSMTHLMRGASNRQKLLEMVLPTMISLSSANAALMLVPQAKDEDEIIAHEGNDCLRQEIQKQGLRESVRECMKQRTPIFQAGRHCLYAVIPLQSSGTLHGVLVLSWPQGFQPSDMQQELVTTISEMVGIALGRIGVRETLESQVTRRTREITLLYEILRLYISGEDIDTIAGKSLKILVNALHASSGLIHLINPSGQSINVIAHVGLAPELLTEVLDEDQDPQDWAMISQGAEPVMIFNLPGRDDLPSLFARSGYQSSCAAPIRAHETTLGAICIFYQNEPYVSGEDLKLMNLSADQLGIVIERSMLRHQARQAAVIEERARLARELHDSVTQSLYSLTFMADALQGLAAQEQWDRLKKQLALVQEASQQALKEMRLLVYELAPTSSEQQGLATLLKQRLSYVEQRSGMQTSLEIDGELDLPLAQQMVIYRIAQEALNNVIKHAHASRVRVMLHARDRGMHLEVTDNGIGFDSSNAPSGMGLRNMQERAEQLGGRLHIKSQPGEGASVYFTFEIATARSLRVLESLSAKNVSGVH